VTVVIIGGGATGDAAAEALRKSGFDGPVVLVGADPHPACYRPHLSKQFLRDEVGMDKVLLRQPGDYERMDVDWRAGRRAVSASRAESSIQLDDGSSVRFDTLVLATGGTPRWLDGVPRLSNVHALRTVDDGIALKEALAGSRRLLVIGAGFIGAEVASSARAMGRDVLMVEVAAVPLARVLGEDMGEGYARLHRERGVDLRTGTSVAEWIADGDRVVAVRLSDGVREDVDLVLVAVGIEPDVALARDLGLALGAGGVLVDEALRAEDHIYCGGDIAAHLHPVYGRHVRVEHWQVARKQGQAIGEAIAGEPKPYDELPWFWSDQYDMNLQYVGNAVGFDQVVRRGAEGERKVSTFYLREGRVDAVLALNDARSVRFGRELIGRRVPVSPDALADESTDLRDLARPPSA
jgi:3-phenylpropionate/trans-cinnamate dioxygenase ferredoxin reductase subunit